MYWELGLGAAVAVVTSLIACRLLITAGLFDSPNDPRKPHRAPTPTSGGLGIALGFGAGLLAVSLLSTHEWRAQVGFWGFTRLSLVTAFACAFLGLGAFDDARPLGPRTKFAVFAALSIGSVLAVGPVMHLPLGGGTVVFLGFWFGLLGSALFVFTLVNSVNFMDGVNGLAMGSVSIGLLALSVIAMLGHGPGVAAMALCGACALAGFLYWNFPKGHLFAGDSGALFAGALAALISLLAVVRVPMSAFVPPILFFPLLADVLLTLAWRVRKKRRVLAGHAEHLYQIAYRSGLTARQTTLLYWSLMAVCGAIGISAARFDATNIIPLDYAPVAALASLALISLVVSALVRGSATRRNLGEV